MGSGDGESCQLHEGVGADRHRKCASSDERIHGGEVHVAKKEEE